MNKKTRRLFFYLIIFFTLTGVTSPCNGMLPQKKPTQCIAINCEKDWVVHLKIYWLLHLKPWCDFDLFYCDEHMELFEEFCPNKPCKIIEDKRKKHQEAN